MLGRLPPPADSYGARFDEVVSRTPDQTPDQTEAR